MKKLLLPLVVSLPCLVPSVASARTVSGAGDAVPQGYVPPLVANGELAMTVDRTFAVKDVPGGIYSQGVFLEGRRVSHPKRELLPQGTWRKVLEVDGAEPKPVSWAQTLDIASGLVRCRLGYASLDFEGETFIPFTENTVAIRMTVRSKAQDALKVVLGVRYEPPRHERIVGRRNGLAWTYRSYGYKVIDGVTELSDADDVFKLAPGELRTVTRFLVFSDSMRPNRPGARDRDYAALRAAHVKGWADFFAESSVRLPDPVLQEMWTMANYHLRVNATPWSFPVGILNSHWQGLYFGFDEMYMYQGLASAGHLDLARHEPDYRFSTLPAAIARTSYMGRYRDYGARWHWESLEDGDSEGTVPGEWQDHIFHMATIARCAWLQWRYGRDRTWFAEKGYPLVLQCARYFLRNWVYRAADGDTYIGKCCDLERLGPARDHPFMTTCGAISAMRMAAEACALLKTNAVEAAEFRATADALERCLPQQDGRYVACRGETQDSMATLAGFFPFPIFPPDHEPQRKAVRHFIDEGRASGNMYPVGNRICPWYSGTMSAAASWMEDRAEPVRWLREAGSAAGLFGEYFEINEPPACVNHPWFATAAGNCLYAISQMLLCDRGGQVYLGFTVPTDWTDYAFRLPSQQGVTVDLAVKGGRLARLRLTPRDGVSGPFRLVFRPDVLDGVSLPAGVRQVAKAADRVTLETGSDLPRKD